LIDDTNRCDGKDNHNNDSTNTIKDTIFLPSLIGPINKNHLSNRHRKEENCHDPKTKDKRLKIFEEMREREI
jgi:hypothetical protein